MTCWLDHGFTSCRPPWILEWHYRRWYFQTVCSSLHSFGQGPLLSFEAYEDYVTDVKWHPLHPSIFAASDAQGHLDVWDLQGDLDSYLYREESLWDSAINKISWAQEGKLLLSGDCKGHVAVYEVTSSEIKEGGGADAGGRFQERLTSLVPSGDSKKSNSAFAPLVSLTGNG